MACWLSPASVVDLLIGRFGSRRARQPISRKCLELDRIGAGRSGDIYQPHRHSHVAIVVDARLGDDEAGLAAANAPGADGNRRSHVCVLARPRISVTPNKS